MSEKISSLHAASVSTESVTNSAHVKPTLGNTSVFPNKLHGKSSSTLILPRLFLVSRNKIKTIIKRCLKSVMSFDNALSCSNKVITMKKNLLYRYTIIGGNIAW